MEFIKILEGTTIEGRHIHLYKVEGGEYDGLLSLGIEE